MIINFLITVIYNTHAKLSRVNKNLNDYFKCGLCAFPFIYVPQISFKIEFPVYLEVFLFVNQELKGYFLHSGTHVLFVV